MSRTVITNVFCIDCLVHRILQFKSTIQQNLTETKLKHSSHITLVNCANVHSSKLCTRVMTLWPKIQQSNYTCQIITNWTCVLQTWSKHTILSMKLWRSEDFWYLFPLLLILVTFGKF